MFCFAGSSLRKLSTKYFKALPSSFLVVHFIVFIVQYLVSAVASLTALRKKFMMIMKGPRMETFENP